jgi:hypothetical protein
MLRRCLAIALLSALSAGLSTAALAQLRTIPADAKRGEIRHVQEMEVQIDGVTERLSAGAQIRNASNMIVLPVAIPAGALVRYRRDGEGRVHRIWILTPEEAAKPDAPRDAK